VQKLQEEEAQTLALSQEQQQLDRQQAAAQSSSRHAEQLSGLYGLSLSAAICMADLVRQVRLCVWVAEGGGLMSYWHCQGSGLVCDKQHRAHVNNPQVEVGCVERGHALAYAFNAAVSTGEELLGELRGQNAALMAANGQLAAQQAELSKELKSVDFLRWALRLGLGCYACHWLVASTRSSFKARELTRSLL
jgi:hypothetical protein